MRDTTVISSIKTTVDALFGSSLRNGTALTADRWVAPTWLTGAREVEVVSYPPEGNPARFLSVLGGIEAGASTISTDVPFKRIDMEVNGLEAADSVSVEAMFQTAAGEEIKETSVLRKDGSFEVGDRFPIKFTIDRPAKSVVLRMSGGNESQSYVTRLKANILNRFSMREYGAKSVRTGLPVPRVLDDAPPIFIVSIDTLRYDLMDQLGPLIESLGPDHTIPQEPRTQGYKTTPSHASLFTGVHPGNHRCVGGLVGPSIPIRSDLVTLAEFLGNEYYKTAALVSITNIHPNQGFARGFQRFQLNRMNNWLKRDVDARTNVDQVNQWIDDDVANGNQRLFYFVHVLDPHLPYLPPLPPEEIKEIDLEAIREYRETFLSVGEGQDYLELLTTDLDIDDETVEKLKSFYYESVEYTARQIARFIQKLKETGLYEHALIIITGDHGEEFGERGFYSHNSLYDANIRPFMVVKTPADAEWDVPNEASIIDIFPTIAYMLGENPPEQCEGTAWQEKIGGMARVTERISPDWYCVSVELDRIKSIFTFHDDYPLRPSEDQIERGPVRAEFYDLDEVRKGNFGEVEPPESVQDEMLRIAKDHIAHTVDETGGPKDERVPRPTQETEELLEHLGYK